MTMDEHYFASCHLVEAGMMTGIGFVGEGGAVVGDLAVHTVLVRYRNSLI